MSTPAFVAIIIHWVFIGWLLWFLLGHIEKKDLTIMRLRAELRHTDLFARVCTKDEC